MSYSSNSNNDFEGFSPQVVENADRNIGQVDSISISDVDSTDNDDFSTDSDSEIDSENANCGAKIWKMSTVKISSILRALHDPYHLQKLNPIF